MELIKAPLALRVHEGIREKEIEQMNVKFIGCWAIVSSRAALIHTPRKDWSWYDFTMLYQQGTLSLRDSTEADFIQNYFLWKRMFDFFDKPDKCRKPVFLRGNIYSLSLCHNMVV